MMSHLEKQLRKTNKKIRHLKTKENWNIVKISELEETIRDLNVKIQIEKDDNDTKRRMEEMDDNDWIDYFYEDQVTPIDDHTIPNTSETRRHKKKVIQNLNEHLMEQYMENQMKVRMNIIQSLKDQLDKDKDKNKRTKIVDPKMEEFLKIRMKISNNFHLKSV